MRKDNRPPKEERTLKRGDVREDGMVFFTYSPNYKDGERWVTASKFSELIAKEKIRDKAREPVGYRPEYYQKNKEVLKERSRDYYRKNKKEVIRKGVAYSTKRHRENPRLKVEGNLRNRIWHTIKRAGSNKAGHSMDLTGCDRETLLSHIASQFTDGMTWDNYGLHGWHIDHIKPCASFDLSLESEQRKCFNYTNLQPLWAGDNLRKGSKLDT